LFVGEADGNGLTVTTFVAATLPQEFVAVYDIVAVPTDAALITPVLPTVATVPLVLLQVPPGVASLKLIVAPAQTAVVPAVIVPASGNTLINVSFAPAVASAKALLVVARLQR
jgi:hypothetical protein